MFLITRLLVIGFDSRRHPFHLIKHINLSILYLLVHLSFHQSNKFNLIKGEWSRNEFELPGPKTYNQLLRPPFKEWKEQPVNHSISFHFIPPIQKKITFFFIAFISWNLLNEMEGIKKYYNSKLIEQLADNIKTKFIWFLWRKQVVRLVWVEEMKWIIDEFMNQLWMKWNPLKQRRPPIQFLFFFPFSLFENERDEEKKRIDGQLAAGNGRVGLASFAFSSLWVNGAGTAQCSAKRKRAKQEAKSARLFFSFISIYWRNWNKLRDEMKSAAKKAKELNEMRLFWFMGGATAPRKLKFNFIEFVGLLGSFLLLSLCAALLLFHSRNERKRESKLERRRNGPQHTRSLSSTFNGAPMRIRPQWKLGWKELRQTKQEY